MVRVLLADDQAWLRSAMRLLLEQEPERAEQQGGRVGDGVPQDELEIPEAVPQDRPGDSSLL